MKTILIPEILLQRSLIELHANSDLLTKLETLLDDYFKSEQLLEKGIPTVQFVAGELNLSPNYLSDMLRVQTGQTTQQHIQNRVIEKAKELLATNINSFLCEPDTLSRMKSPEGKQSGFLCNPPAVILQTF